MLKRLIYKSRYFLHFPIPSSLSYISRFPNKKSQSQILKDETICKKSFIFTINRKLRTKVGITKSAQYWHGALTNNQIPFYRQIRLWTKIQSLSKQ